AFGTRTGPDVALDWDTIVRRQHAIVRELQPPAAAFEKSGAKIYLGEARFVNAHTVQADGQQIQGDKIVIAAGSEPVVPPVPGCGLAITSDDLLFLPQFPQSLVLVGGGVIGLEMAGAFSDLGSTVTVIARDPEVLPTLERLSGARGAITAHITSGGAPLAVTAQQVCLAIGRRYTPRRTGTDAIGLEHGGLGLRVDAYLRTTLPHVYAAGDAAGNVQL